MPTGLLTLAIFGVWAAVLILIAAVGLGVGFVELWCIVDRIPTLSARVASGNVWLGVAIIALFVLFAAWSLVFPAYLGFFHFWGPHIDNPVGVP